MRATVVGAGVAGLTTALTLAERGATVSLVERSRELGGNASWLAGGMLAPFCEGESAPPSVVELGRRAIDWWAARVPGVVREGTLVVAPPRDAAEIDRFAARTSGHQRVGSAKIAALEPDLAGRFHKGLFFAGEGHLDPRAMRALVERLRRAGVDVRFGVDGRSARLRETVGPPSPAGRRAPPTALLEKGSCSIAGASPRAPHLPQLRGVRGEMIRVRTREVCLTRAVRLLHPRFPLYVVPRANGEFMIGATMIESAEKGARLRALGARALERGLCAAPGVRRSGDSRIERRRPACLSRQRAAHRGAGRADFCQRLLSPRLPARAGFRDRAAMVALERAGKAMALTS